MGGLAILGELAVELGSERSAEGVLVKLSRLRPLGFERFSLALSIGEGLSVRHLDSQGKISEGRIPLAGSSFEQPIRSGRPYIANIIGKYSNYFDERGLAEEGFRSYACFPLVAGGEPLGALGVASNAEKAFGESEVAMLSLLAASVAGVLQGARIAERLRKAELISNALFEAGGMVVIADASMRIVGANREAEVLTGYSAEELMRLDLAALFPGIERDRLLGGGVLKLKRKSGELRLVEARASAISDGSAIFFAGSDVTEKMLFESSYRDVVESMHDVVFTINGRGEFTAVNSEAESVLGRPRESLMGSPLSSIVHEQDYRPLGEALHSLSPNSPILRSLELRLLTAKGEPRWFELNGRGYHDASGELIKFTGVLRDIDERKRVAEYEQIVGSVISNSSEPVLSTDTMGVVRFWNRGAELVFGWTREEMVGRSVRELYPEDRKGELDALVRTLNEHGSAPMLETIRLKKGGEPIVVQVLASAIRDSEGKVIGYLEMMRDMTSVKQAEEAERAKRKLEERNRQLQQLNQMKSEFVSNVSHELRTPLTSIQGYSSLLLAGELGKMDDRQREYVEIINSETARLAKLINDLLDISRMERGKFRLSPRLFDPREFVESCSCSSLAEKKGLYVKWNISDDVQQVFCDSARISQVLINLISNAIKFTEKGGVTINIWRKSRGYVQIDVEDTGIGISEEDQKKLFKPFYQAPRPDGQKREGSGLGLAISKEIVRLHGGKIWVESKLGEGTKFSFTLPTGPKRRKKQADRSVEQLQAQNGGKPIEQPAQIGGSQRRCNQRPCKLEQAARSLQCLTPTS